jgi:outer membrane protein assembly factor BamB
MMNRILRLQIACACALIFGCGAVWAETVLQASDGWPQWRGPNRDGVAPASPKLLDSWPKGGPKQLWKSAPIPAQREGGCGSVVVSDGKAFVFVQTKRQSTKKFVLTTSALIELGWLEDDELAKKVEEARLSPIRRKGTAAWDAFIKEFNAKLTPEQEKKYASAIRNRLTAPMDNSLSAGALNKLAPIRDKEFNTLEALLEPTVGTHPHNNDAMITKQKLMETCFVYTDAVICLDAASGREIWKKEFPGVIPPPSRYYYLASSTPTISGGKCYVAGSGGTYCLSVKDGATVWKAETKFTDSSPLVANGAAYVCLPDGITAFNAENGQVLWTQPAAKNDCSSAILWTSGGRTCLICGAERKLFCLDPGKGTVIWETYFGQDVQSTPLISGDVLVVQGHYSVLSAFKLTAQKPEKIWSDLKLGDRGSSPLIYQDHVYHPFAESDSPMACLDLKTGVRSWTQAGDNHCSSPTLADGKIVLSLCDHYHYFLVLVRATAEKYEELGRIPIPEKQETFASPAIADGRLYVRLCDGIVCYDLRAE